MKCFHLEPITQRGTMSLEAFAGFYCIFTNGAAVALLTVGVRRWGPFGAFSV